jgi:hypothetical protein
MEFLFSSFFVEFCFWSGYFGQILYIWLNSKVQGRKIIFWTRAAKILLPSFLPSLFPPFLTPILMLPFCVNFSWDTLGLLNSRVKSLISRKCCQSTLYFFQCFESLLLVFTLNIFLV